MSTLPEGKAIVYCQGAFATAYGKTAHGLVRHTVRYRVLAMVDSRHAGKDAGEVLDGKKNGIPIYGSVERAFQAAESATHFIIGLAPDGGRLGKDARRDILTAIALGLNVDSGLHDFLCDDPEIAELAREKGVRIRDVRKPPPRNQLHFFSGKITDVTSLRVAALGTDSAVGKRTTAWLLVQGLNRAGCHAELVGTGQTAWMQGAQFCILMDSLVNDFVSGEIEHVVWRCWRDSRPEVIVIEGQGSLMNPAYPGGYEILAAARPHLVILQHAPARKEYDGFPGFPIQPLFQQIRAIEVVSGVPVAAVAVNHEGIPLGKVDAACRKIRAETGLPAFDVLLHGADGLVGLIQSHLGRTPR